MRDDESTKPTARHNTQAMLRHHQSMRRAVASHRTKRLRFPRGFSTTTQLVRFALVDIDEQHEYTRILRHSEFTESAKDWLDSGQECVGRGYIIRREKKE